MGGKSRPMTQVAAMVKCLAHAGAPDVNLPKLRLALTVHRPGGLLYRGVHP